MYRRYQKRRRQNNRPDDCGIFGPHEGGIFARDQAKLVFDEPNIWTWSVGTKGVSKCLPCPGCGVSVRVLLEYSEVISIASESTLLGKEWELYVDADGFSVWRLSLTHECAATVIVSMSRSTARRSHLQAVSDGFVGLTVLLEPPRIEEPDGSSCRTKTKSSVWASLRRAFAALWRYFRIGRKKDMDDE